MDADKKEIPINKARNFEIYHKGAADTHGYLSTAQRYHNHNSSFGKN